MNVHCRGLLPLALIVPVLTGAYEDGCVITVTPLEEEEECELDCERAVNDDGEELCECAEPEPCVLENGEASAPGDVISDDGCTVCRCRADGQVICEESDDCGGGGGGQGCEMNGEVFPPGSTIDDGCNSCFCDEGGGWACTDRWCGCDDPNDPDCGGGGGVCYLDDGTVIGAGEWFDAGDGCNSCWCDEGGFVSCTEMWCGCDDPNDPDCGGGGVCILDDGTAISAGEWFDAGDGCNSCWCDEGGFVSCTEMACCDDTTDPNCGGGGGGVCVLEDGNVVAAGEAFEAGDGCNWCSCTDDGQVVCTMMACPCPDENGDGACDEQPVCTLACEHGYVTDAAGSVLCECKEPVICNGETLCDRMPPICAEGEVPSIVNGCYGECVPAESCTD